MSVAPLSSTELGLFVARCVRISKLTFRDALDLAESASIGNCAAYCATYSDAIFPEHRDDIEAEALRFLAAGELVGVCGPIAYNCISNDGQNHLSDEWITYVGQLEDAQRAHVEQLEREARKATEDAATFDEIGPQAKMSRSKVGEMAISLGFDRVIIAEHKVSECDLQTDYFHARTSRRVVIGFGAGKRESFAQLRKAAGQFPPTSHLGPDCGRFFPRVVFAAQVTDGHRWFCEGESCPWKRHDVEFATRAEAERYISEQEPLEDIHLSNDTIAKFRWHIAERDIEHRECYSMGAGNYLGTDSYSGWQVSSEMASYWQGTEEVEVYAAGIAQAKTVKKAPKRESKLAARVTETDTQETEHGRYVTLTITCGKTSVSVVQCQTRNRGFYSVCTPQQRRRIARTFWTLAEAKTKYRSRVMHLILDAAEAHFSALSAKPSEQAEKPAAVEAKPEPKPEPAAIADEFSNADFDWLNWL